MSVIKGLYKTKIEHTGGLTFKVTLTDFNNQPVISEPVTVKIENLNNSSSTTTLTGTTNDNGVVEFTVSTSPCHFLVKCNGVEEWISYNDWVVYQSGSNYTIYENIDNVKVVVRGKIAVTTNYQNAKIGVINDTNYIPLKPVVCQCYYGSNTYVAVSDFGQIILKDINGSWTPNVGVELTYPKRT